MSDQNLESTAEELLRSGKANAETLSALPALYSIAVSLKRIADSLEGNEQKYGMVNIISDISQHLSNR